MKFEYTYRTTAFELWQLSMYYIYGSMVGVCNIVFTVAVFALALAKWNVAGQGFKLLLVAGCCLFTLIQPLLVYDKAGRQAAGITQDTSICFDDGGIHVTLGEQNSELKWDTVKRISKKPTMIVVFSSTTHGFVLTNRVLGKEREAFYTYVASKVKK